MDFPPSPAGSPSMSIRSHSPFPGFNMSPGSLSPAPADRAADPAPPHPLPRFDSEDEWMDWLDEAGVASLQRSAQAPPQQHPDADAWCAMDVEFYLTAYREETHRDATEAWFLDLWPLVYRLCVGGPDSAVGHIASPEWPQQFVERVVELGMQQDVIRTFMSRFLHVYELGEEPSTEDAAVMGGVWPFEVGGGLLAQLLAQPSTYTREQAGGMHGFDDSETARRQMSSISMLFSSRSVSRHTRTSPTDPPLPREKPDNGPVPQVRVRDIQLHHQVPALPRSGRRAAPHSPFPRL